MSMEPIDERNAEIAALKAALESFSKMAKELKKERDEAIADRDIARLSAQDSDRAHDRMVGELEKVYKERDEARDLAQQMSESNQVLMADVRFYRKAFEDAK